MNRTEHRYEQANPEPGQRVRVTAGALAGVEGVVVPADSEDSRVVITVAYSDWGVHVRVPRGLVECVM
jgi:transcription antitermination factor NusG